MRDLSVRGRIKGVKVYDEEAEKDADPYYHCSSTADRTEFYTGKGNFADDSFPDPIPEKESLTDRYLTRTF